MNEAFEFGNAINTSHFFSDIPMKQIIFNYEIIFLYSFSYFAN